MRRIGWFSAGAASAVACLVGKPDVIAYCETNAEDEDNARFLADCERVFGWDVVRLRSEKYADTWDVWEKTRWIAGPDGARCTGELKVAPRVAFQGPNDIHIFGYTPDEQHRVDKLKTNFFDLTIETPLIDLGLTKESCLAIIQSKGLDLPRVYGWGFPHANCIPCPKATSPNYYALVRKTHPDRFERMAKLTRELGVRLARIKGKRVFIDEIPEDWPTTNPLVPSCDFLCAIADV